MPSELHVYDFDGTLFRSPEAPVGWDRHRNWWGVSESLDHPCVPLHPDASWWIPKVVSMAKASNRDPDVLSVLATGRGLNSFARFRVPELLGQAGLDFYAVHLHPDMGGTDTADFKAAIVAGYLRGNPDIRIVKAWDDTGKNLGAMAAAASRYGISFEGVTIKVDPKEVLCPDLAAYNLVP